MAAHRRVRDGGSARYSYEGLGSETRNLRVNERCDPKMSQLVTQSPPLTYGSIEQNRLIRPVQTRLLYH